MGAWQIALQMLQIVPEPLYDQRSTGGVGDDAREVNRAYQRAYRERHRAEIRQRSRDYYQRSKTV